MRGLSRSRTNPTLWVAALLAPLLAVAVLPASASAQPAQRAAAAQSAQHAQPMQRVPGANAAQTPGQQYVSMGYGVFLHYGLSTSIGMKPWDYDPHDYTPADYHPNNLDPDQWMDAIADSGAKYIVFTAKHHDGFAMWDTHVQMPGQTQVWSSMAPPNNIDVLRQVVDAAHAHNLKVVIYYSWYDRYQPGGDVNPKDPSSDRTTNSDAYLRYVKAQLHELLDGNYGDIAGLWMDIAPMDFPNPHDGKPAPSDSQIQQLADLIHSTPSDPAFIPNFPNATRDTDLPSDVRIFEGNKETLNCDYPAGMNYPLPVEAEQAWNAAAGPGWWQFSDTAAPSQTVDQLMAAYNRTHSVGGTFTLNVPPGPDGLLPPQSVDLLEQFGQRLRDAGADPGNPYDVLDDGTYMYDDGAQACGSVTGGIQYTGSWIGNAFPGAYDDTRHYSNTAGDYAELSFDGTAVEVQVQTRPGHGYADISLDGGPADKVDTYSNPPVDQVVVWHKDGLTPGPHTVRVTVDGTHDENATNSWVSLDGIHVTPVSSDAPPAGATSGETVTTTVAQQGGLTMSVADSSPVVLPAPTLSSDGTSLTTSGSMHPVTVTDMRADSPGWNVAAQVGDFSSAAGVATFGADHLGWTPSVLDQADGQQVTVGGAVAPGTDGGGLSTARTLASAPAGSAVGTAHVGADLALALPTDTALGSYTATLTLTAI